MEDSLFSAVTDDVDSLLVFAVRTPTIPPATHTNVYVGGDAIFDPASPYADEQSRLERAIDRLPKCLTKIILTHHHVDHVSGAEVLARALKLPIWAHPETAKRVRFKIDREIADGDIIAGLRAIHTPGHAKGHLCFLDEKSRAIIAGDMIASIGTIVVPPDDGGDMIEYLASLALLRSLKPSMLLPSHGAPIRDADARLGFYIAHRLQRESRVLAALSDTPRSLAELVPLAYPDVAPAIYPLAEHSLLAHLLKLEREHRARRAGESWSL